MLKKIRAKKCALEWSFAIKNSQKNKPECLIKVPIYKTLYTPEMSI